MAKRCDARHVAFGTTFCDNGGAVSISGARSEFICDTGASASRAEGCRGFCRPALLFWSPLSWIYLFIIIEHFMAPCFNLLMEFESISYRDSYGNEFYGA